MSASVSALTGGRARLMGLIGAGHFYSHFSGLILPPLFPVLKAEFGVSYVALGSLISIFAFATSVAQIPVGFLVDRLGARSVLIVGLALVGAAFLLIGLATAFWQIALLMALAGLGNSVFHPADYAILSERIEEGYLGRAMSIHGFTGYIGWVAAPATMLGLASLTDWRVAVAIAGLLGIAIAAVMAWRGGGLGSPAQRGPSGGGGRDSALRRGIGLMQSTPMLMMFGFFLLTAASTAGITTFTVVAVMSLYGVDVVVANYALTGFFVGMAAGVLVGGWLADLTGRHNLVTAVAIAGSALFVALFAPGTMPLYFAVAALAACGLLFGITTPSRDMLVRAATPPGSIGVAFGFTSTGLGIGSAVGPIICGWIMDAGHPDWAFLMLAAVMVLSIATLVAARPAAARPIGG